MQAELAFEPNPRAVIGGNGGPALDESDTSAPTAEEARLVFSAIAYVQFKRPGLENIVVKRKGGKVLGWRLLVANALKDRVRQSALAELLKFNRKTTGENQQRADRWAEYDDEFGDGEFGELLADLRHAIIADSHVRVDEIDAKLSFFIKKDPELRELERIQREAEAAAAEMERDVAEAERRRKERERLAAANDLAKSLKGVENKAAILAKHKGPKHIAKKASDAALVVVEKLIKKASKGVHPPTSALNAEGLQECLTLGLAKNAEPYLSKSEDPMIGPTALCAQVYAEALAQGRLKTPKRKKAEA
jgi:hypothetical protein